MSVVDDLLRSLGGGQYGDPSTPAMPTAPMGQGQGYTANVLQHLQDVISGKVAAQSALGQNNYDPNQSFAANALNPKAIEQATEVAGGIGPGAIRAWHASPYDFNKFDINKVGTGQGAQSYGHGIYAAESPAVSGRGGQYDLEFTAKNLGKYDLNPGELQIHRMLREDRSDMDILGELARGGGYTFDEAMAALERVKGAKAKIYEVDIHADPKQFLDWDKSLGQQAAQVQDAVNRVGRDPRFDPGRITDDMRGSELQRILQNPEAAAALNQRGIPGIRYLDQGSRGAGEGSSNYAIFDPKIIEILRKYGIFPPIAAGGLLGASPGGARGSEPPT